MGFIILQFVFNINFENEFNEIKKRQKKLLNDYFYEQGMEEKFRIIDKIIEKSGRKV
jgi:hypothetical protein